MSAAFALLLRFFFAAFFAFGFAVDFLATVFGRVVAVLTRIKCSSSARRTCGEFFPPMRRITIKQTRTWHRYNGPSNVLAGSPLFRSWL